MHLDVAANFPPRPTKQANRGKTENSRRTNVNVNRPLTVIEHTALTNGLKVVVAPNMTTPVVTVGVYYKVGSRLEPRGRSGFAHLFEHMMFQGSANVPKTHHIKLISSSGGRSNASTNYDWTNYFEAVPSNALDRVLWLESDRMRALEVNNENLHNQRDVVKEEVRCNVMNQPYGGFPWLDLPLVAYRNWANAHSLYGDFEDLDAATVEDVQAFFKTYYVPNNAVVLIIGNVTADEGFALSEKYFGDIPSGPTLALPDTSEPEQEEERYARIDEKFGDLPAIAVGYSLPKRSTQPWYAIALLDQVLHGGKGGRINRELVFEKQIAVDAGGGIDDFFGYNGPALMMTQFRLKPEYRTDEALAAFDSVISGVQERGVAEDELEQLKVKWRSQYYSHLESGGAYMPKYGLMHLLACFTLFDGQPELVNKILDEFRAITREDLQSAAKQYLQNKNRAIVFRTPAKGDWKDHHF